MTKFILLFFLAFGFRLFALKQNAVFVNCIQPVGSAASEEKSLDLELLTKTLEEEMGKAGNFTFFDHAIALNTDKRRELAATVSYSPYDANLLGIEIKAPLVVLGRIRLLGDRAWLQFGLFDAEAQETIKEVSGYYSKKELIAQAIPEIAKQLAETYKFDKNDSTKTAKPPVIKRIQPWTWVLIGAVGTAALFVIEDYATRPKAKNTTITGTNVTVEW